MTEQAHRMACVIAVVILAGGADTSTQQPRVPGTKPSEHDIEVTATGCLSGDTLVEMNLNRNPSNPVPNPARRWRLRLTSAQREAVKMLDAGRQVEVWGVADRRELESGMVGKSVKVGPGRAYVGAESKKTPAREPVVVPTLVADSIKQTQDRCR